MTSSAKKLASMVQELKWPLNLNCENNTKKKKMRVKAVSVKVICVLFVVSFLAGALLSSQAGIQQRKQHSLHCDHKRKLVEQDPRDARGEVSQPFENNMITLTSRLSAESHTLQKAFVVIGINTAFSSKRRRDSLRNTWMPKGEKLKKLEKEKGIVLRFVIGHSSTANGVLDKAIAAEDAKYKDFFRLNHIEGYHNLSTKTRLFFSTAITLWDAEFYVKVDDDVHVNLGVLVSNLAKHRSKPRIYIGCMKSGPVLSEKGVKYYEPEYWKFGEEGNKYFRHATGQIYAISKDLATYISINSDILHLFANEDVSLGSWFIGMEVEHVDDHSMCCGTPPECEFKLREGKVCASSFDWNCSGICRSVERMKQVHSACGEGDGAIWNVEL